jgi:hypothetical protein
MLRRTIEGDGCKQAGIKKRIVNSRRCQGPYGFLNSITGGGHETSANLLA